MVIRFVSVDPTVLNAPGYLVAGDSYVVGRSKKCQFVVSDQSVSRSHAKVIAKRRSVLVQDLGSTNGTFVEGQRIGEVEVLPSQVVRFGRVLFQLTTDDESLTSGEDISALSTSKAITSNATNELPALKLLSESQRRVLDQLLMGMQEKEVAMQLNISPHTVHNHAKEIYKKLGVSTRAELLALFVSDSKVPKKSGP